MNCAGGRVVVSECQIVGCDFEGGYWVVTPIGVYRMCKKHAYEAVIKRAEYLETQRRLLTPEQLSAYDLPNGNDVYFYSVREVENW